MEEEKLEDNVSVEEVKASIMTIKKFCEQQVDCFRCDDDIRRWCGKIRFEQAALHLPQLWEVNTDE